MESKQNNFGLSKKTNIAIAAIGAMATAADHWKALIAIGIVALIGTSYQFILDYRSQSHG